MTIEEAMQSKLLELISEGPSIAPREAALALVKEGQDWRKLLPLVRAQAKVLHAAGKLNFIRKKKIVSPDGLKGVFRLAKAELSAEGETPEVAEPSNNEGS